MTDDVPNDDVSNDDVPNDDVSNDDVSNDDVMAHLQAAALELIAAARAVLDAAEHTVRDPAGVDLGSLLSGFARPKRGRDDGKGDGGDGVERIPVS